VYPGIWSGVYGVRPRGVILHGSRSGIAGHPALDEWSDTAHWATIEPNGYGWSATIGPDRVASHMPLNLWGWNARGCSPHYLAVEFAQANVSDAIDDAAVAAFCWWFVDLARAMWSTLPRVFPSHAELDGTPEYGQHDGKTDAFPLHDPRMVDLRMRINARLDALGAAA
jgi:hypothetical protein